MNALKKINPDVKHAVKIFMYITVSAILFTVLTAILPHPPYTLTEPKDLLPLKNGFPLTFTELTPDTEDLYGLMGKGINNSFIFPRYGRYDMYLSVGRLFGCIGLNILIFSALFIFFKIFKKHLKAVILIFIAGLTVTAASALLPVPPGTFTPDDLYPMHFGGIINFVEQTPDINADWSGLDAYLKQTYIAPHYNIYTSFIDIPKAILCLAVNTAIIAALVFAVKFICDIIKSGKKAATEKYFGQFKKKLSDGHLTNRNNSV